MAGQEDVPALAIRGVGHSYGRSVALEDVSLTVARGVFHVLLGPNGAGKTTLFNLATRLFDTRQGRIEVCGHDLGSASGKALAELGVVFQSRALDPSLTVAQNIVYRGALHGIPRGAALERGAALVERIGLGDRIGEKAARLSGGQVRRVEIALALLHGPRLLMCDEATVGLDVKARADIVADIHALAADEGVGVLWATHLIDEVEPADPVTVLHRGRVVAEGSASALAGGRSLADVFLGLTGGGTGAGPAGAVS